MILLYLLLICIYFSLIQVWNSTIIENTQINLNIVYKSIFLQV